MCFSTESSFIAVAFLTAISIACAKKVKKKQHYMLAAIPLIFAIQQLTEGILWLSNTRDWPQVQTITPYLFLFFAFFLWPMWIPLSLRLIEPEKNRQKQLTILSMLGILLGAYLYQTVLSHGITAQILDCHIYYNIPLSWPEHVVGTVLYLLCTVAAFFVSSLPIMWLMGILVALAYVVSYLFYYTYLTSVWCFFAAILSGFVYVILGHLERKKSLQP